REPNCSESEATRPCFLPSRLRPTRSRTSPRLPKCFARSVLQARGNEGAWRVTDGVAASGAHWREQGPVLGARRSRSLKRRETAVRKPVFSCNSPQRRKLGYALRRCPLK